ncbi:sodium-independent anion transporter [Planctellipticum variicoloris]|uniref:sodium-independent anion transporter n=1 Tax=Planctellipticum variicoloris TaxID=3064265 RepID=UPI0030135066|nr:sodium-independent anion transporter [Planctomycetaceae bacterium SH412]
MPELSFIDRLNSWMLLTATVAIVLASLEAGYRLGVFRRRRSDSEKETPVGEVVAATLGLLAFLLAFIFGFAASRFESRKELVIQEANAVGTAWLRAGLLPAPESAESRNLYRDSVAPAWKESRPGTLPSRSDSRDTDDVRQVVWGKIAALPQLRLVVCDLSNSPFVDVVGARLLSALQRDLAARGVQLRIVEAHARNRDLLRAEGLEGLVGHLGCLQSVDQVVAEFEFESPHKAETPR